jgi:hypothetical protein
MTVDRPRRTKLQVVTLGVTAVSAVGFVLALKGLYAVSQGEDPSGPSDGIFYGWMQLGWLLTAGLGLVAWGWGRRSGHRGTAAAGRIAVGYVVVSFVVAVYTLYHNGTS